MLLYHHLHPSLGPSWSIAEGDRCVLLAADSGCCGSFLASLLQWDDPAALLRHSLNTRPSAALPSPDTLLAPLDRQEVWAAGVTYLRSKVARMEESEGAARFYDLVYDAERPELFLKATAARVVPPGGEVLIRADARWNVPEPELALLLSPQMRIVGYTLGNDMSSRDIEGENPLYLPQAKVYRGSCSLGPAILIEEAPGDHRDFPLELRIERGGATAFHGTTSTSQMKRTFADLAAWLGRDNDLPSGALLLTGTGLVPGDDFTLEAGDRVSICSPEIGTLFNPVVRGSG